jgi:hypothetical protein
MRTEWKLLLGLGIFMLPLGIAYWVTTTLWTGVEIGGSIMLIVVAIAFIFMGTYLFIQSRRLGGSRPEDYDALPSDGAGAVGSFPTSSVWPIVGALGAVTLGYGLIFGLYLALPGLFLIFATVLGLAREAEVSGLHSETISGYPDIQPDPTFSDQVKK